MIPTLGPIEQEFQTYVIPQFQEWHGGVTESRTHRAWEVYRNLPPSKRGLFSIHFIPRHKQYQYIYTGAILLGMGTKALNLKDNSVISMYAVMATWNITHNRRKGIE